MEKKGAKHKTYYFGQDQMAATPSVYPGLGLGGASSQSPVSALSISDTAFTLKSFAGAANAEQDAEKWLDAFNLYTDFKRLTGNDKLRLFKLMLTEQAAVWLKSVPPHLQQNIDQLMKQFQERYGLSRVDRWRQTANIWSRKQGPQETVADYIAAMQEAATRVDMPEHYLADAIVQGLRPELRLFVLHSKASTIPQILDVARTSEAAHSANVCNSISLETVTLKLDALLSQQQEAMKTLRAHPGPVPD